MIDSVGDLCPNVRVSLRRIASAAFTIVVAIVVALAVPVSQLRTISVVTTCCCPDPAKCHCPDHKPDHSNGPSIRACHKDSHESIAPQLPSFTAPQLAVAAAPARIISATFAMPLSPHAPPPPARPDAPS